MFSKKHTDDTNHQSAESFPKKSVLKGKSYFAVIKNFIDDDAFLRAFFQKQYKYLLLLFFLSMLYVNNRFVYEKKLKDLDKARSEMIDLKYRSLSLSKDLKVAGRRTHIREQLKNKGSDLAEPAEPVIIIQK